MVSSQRESLLRADSKVGRILAIDYGRRRIGLAVSDELGLTAQPLGTVVRTNRRNDLRRLQQIVRKYNVCRIVVGHPLHLDGTAGEMAEEAARFAARIEREVALPVALVDERLTSWEAEQVRAETKPARRRGPVDPIAAAVLLRDYLEREQGQAPSRD